MKRASTLCALAQRSRRIAGSNRGPSVGACLRGRPVRGTVDAERPHQKCGRLGTETGRSNSGLKNRLAADAKMIGVKPTTAP
jgi:hypothetical protein